MSCCVGADPKEWESLCWGSVASWVCPLDVLFVETVGWCSGMDWSQPLSMLVLEPLGRCFSTGQDQQSLVPGLGALGRNYKVIWLVVTCTGLRGAWERLCSEPELVATFAELEPLWLAPWCELRLAASCARFVALNWSCIPGPDWPPFMPGFGPPDES